MRVCCFQFQFCFQIFRQIWLGTSPNDLTLELGVEAVESRWTVTGRFPTTTNTGIFEKMLLFLLYLTLTNRGYHHISVFFGSVTRVGI